jgi:hypothetical protein
VSEAGGEVVAEHVRNWQSVRTVIELLILAGVLWLARSASEQGIQLAGVTVQIATLSGQMANVPGLTLEVAKDRVRLDEHERRINEIEQAKKLK